MRCFLRSDLDRIFVTETHLDSVESVAIGGPILDAAGIAENEQVDVVNLANGNRWTTCAIRHPDEAAFSLNGGGARLGLPGDLCVVMSYAYLGAPPLIPPLVLFFNGTRDNGFELADGGQP